MILDKPYTEEEINSLIDKNGYITGNVVANLTEIIDADLESFLDILSIRLTGSDLLTDISYEPIGFLQGYGLVIQVHGCVSEVLGHG